ENMSNLTNLHTLQFSMNEKNEIEKNLPPNLTKLVINHYLIRHTSLLPCDFNLQSSITSLRILPSGTIYSLPCCLTSLFYKPNREIQIGLFPETLLRLEIPFYIYKLKKGVLPTKLQVLDIGCYPFSITEVGLLPLSLIELEIKKRFIEATTYTNMTKLTTSIDIFTAND